MDSARLNRAKSRLAAAGSPGEAPDAMLIMSPQNRMYITGFSGSSGYVLLAADSGPAHVRGHGCAGKHGQDVLLTDFRYVEQATNEAPAFRVLQHASPYLGTLAELAGQWHIRRLGFEVEHVTVAEHRRLATSLPGVELVPVTGLLEDLRLTKDDGEIKRLEAAVSCADAAFAAVLAAGAVRVGVTEISVAAALESEMRVRGSSRPAYDTIVASGPRSSLPHGRASQRVLQAGDLVTMDFGATVDGYCSDITRTVIVGEANEEQRNLYELVLRAQLAGSAAVRPGVSGRSVDAVSREIIAAAGHGEHFGHGLGHGVGLNIHEGPRLSPVGAEALLQPGMVTSVEPGVYIPGWGGVRIEDLVVVTQDGRRVLTNAPKQLIEVR